MNHPSTSSPDAASIHWHDTNLDALTPSAGAVVSVWLPLVDASGSPVVLQPGPPTDYFVRVCGANGPRLRTAMASVNAMYKENSSATWLPKVGAAYVETMGVEVYAPHGQIRVRCATQYGHGFVVGVMLHLGFAW
jgi:hypothetical protein